MTEPSRKRTLSQQLLHDLDIGMSESELTEKHNLTTAEVRTLFVLARSERRAGLAERARMAVETKGWSNAQIAASFGLTESEVRILLKGE